MLIVLCGDVGVFLEAEEVTKIPFAIGTALRLVCLLKQLKKTKSAKLNVIIDSILFTLPSLLNVGVMLLIVFVVYSILGVHLFWNVKYQRSLDENTNFRTFWSSILVVISCATGEDWNGIMQSLAHVQGDCVTGQTFEEARANGIQGCGTMWAYPYFITFLVVVCLIGMNMLTVVVIEGYMESVNENYSIITAKDFEEFLDNWAVYDPQGTGWISVEQLVYLFFGLDPPLGVYDKKIREKLWKSYKRRIKTSNRSRFRGSLISQISPNEELLVHKNAACVFERRKIQRLLRELRVPLEVGTWRVHFRDVCQRMTVRAIMLKKKEDFE
ncbi:MAG: ion transporter [Candidatus Pacebacteria bacterium]|nr:ion transporter [Candidatus Paceibacterota bacterium]